MKTSNPYQGHAIRCRELAEEAKSSEDRDILLKIADTWDWIARDYEPADSNRADADGAHFKAAE